MFSVKRKKYKQLEDIELINILKTSSNRIAFGEIYERYAHLVMGVCLKYLRDEAESEDLCSSIFEKLEAKIQKFEIVYFKSWLYTLVKNECFMHLRKNKHLFVHYPAETLSIEEDKSVDFDLKELKIELLNNSISKLNNEQASCIRLFYFENLSYLEIATQTKLDILKVKSYIQNGKRNLKNQLINHEEFRSQI